MSGILSIIMDIFIEFVIGYLSIDVFEKKTPHHLTFQNIWKKQRITHSLLLMLHYILLYNSENQQIEIDTKAINVSGVSVNYGIFTSDNDISKYPQ